MNTIKCRGVSTIFDIGNPYGFYHLIGQTHYLQETIVFLPSIGLGGSGFNAPIIQFYDIESSSHTMPYLPRVKISPGEIGTGIWLTDMILTWVFRIRWVYILMESTVSMIQCLPVVLINLSTYVDSFMILYTSRNWYSLWPKLPIYM